MTPLHAQADRVIQLAPFYRRPDALAQWLTVDGAIGAVGEPVALRLRSGRRLTGHVLADTGRELALTWEELGGALALRALPLGSDARALGADVLSWQEGPALLQALQEELDRALEELQALLAAR